MPLRDDQFELLIERLRQDPRGQLDALYDLLTNPQKNAVINSVKNALIAQQNAIKTSADARITEITNV